MRGEHCVLVGRTSGCFVGGVADGKMALGPGASSDARTALGKRGDMNMRWRALACAAALGAAGLVAQPAPASAQSLLHPALVSDNPANTTPNVLDGAVKAIAQVGNRIVIGGSFTSVAPPGSTTGTARSFIVAFDAASGALDTTFAPVLDGQVLGLLPAPDGVGIYVAGAFNNVNGVRRASLVELDAVTGKTMTGFKPPALDGVVTDLELVGNRLYLGGSFATVAQQPRVALAAVDTATGAFVPAVDARLFGLHNGGRTHVEHMAVTPDGKRMVIVGNFTHALGQPRRQIVMLGLTEAGVTLDPWFTSRFAAPCAAAFDTYMRDVDFSADGSYLVIGTTGAGFAGTLCDSITRWESVSPGGDLQPTWINYTGGDTVTAVTVVGSVVYVGGHFRWLNNPFARDRQGPGAVPRSALAALDARNGLPLSWNPGRTRGYGVTAWLATPSGLWMGHDTDRVNNERRARITFFPLANGRVLPAEAAGSLPGTVYALGRPVTTPVGEVLYRINAGGPALASLDAGPGWAADINVTSPLRTSGSRTATAAGTIWDTTAAVPATVPWLLFSTERYDPVGDSEMSWALPVPAGKQVQVRLYFGNRCTCTNVAGKRKFDVRIERALVLDDYDMVADAGDQIGTVKTFTATSDGTINIDFLHVLENPTLSGIEVLGSGPVANAAAGGDDVVARAFDGTVTDSSVLAGSGVAWHQARGAFMLDGTLHTGHVDGHLYRRSFDGGTFGPVTRVNLNQLGDFSNELQTLTGMYYDAGRLYFTLAGSNALHYRYFTAESGVVGATRFTIPAAVGGVDWGALAGLFRSGSMLYVASAADGGLRALPLTGGVPAAGCTAQLVSGPGVDGVDWRSRGLFVRP